MSEPYIPHDYQKTLIKFIISRACAGVLLKPGLGKTSGMLAAFSLLKKQGIVNSMLVICPLRPMYSVWPGEVARWKEFNHLKVSILHGPYKDEALRAKADIYVVNPEGLAWLFRAAARSRPTDVWPWDVLVIDESTRFKHVRTQRFITLKPWLTKFKRRYILTGSPAPNGLLDLFGQIYLLDLGNALGQYISHFRLKYFDPTGYQGYTWLPKPGSDKAIYDKLRPLVIQMDDTALDMPPLVYNRVNVELPKKARAAYDQMERLMMASLDDGVITAANAAVATGKCRQIANGGLYHEGGEDWTHIHEAKVDATEEIIEELSGKPVLIAYEFRHDLDRLLRRLGPDTPHIGGGVSVGQFREIERRWNAGEIPVLLAQPQSVAHGLNLQGAAADVIFFGETWNLEDREQLIRRVWRQGQKSKVVVHDIIAKKTVDEVILAAIGRKDKTQSALLAALRTHLSKRAV